MNAAQVNPTRWNHWPSRIWPFVEKQFSIRCASNTLALPRPSFAELQPIVSDAELTVFLKHGFLGAVVSRCVYQKVLLKVGPFGVRVALK
jgi:hypothetical protein